MAITFTPELQSVQSALEALCQGFQQDGYELNITASGSGVIARIVALPGACEECLVPKDVVRYMLLEALKNAIPGISVERIQVEYPGEDIANSR